MRTFKSFSYFYLSLSVSLLMVCVWNSSRLYARADMLSEPMRSWAQESIDTLANESLRERLSKIQAQLSQQQSTKLIPLKSIAMEKPQESIEVPKSSSTQPDKTALNEQPGSASEPISKNTSAPSDINSVIFAGDSLANGYAAGAIRAVQEMKKNTRIVDAGKISTGLVSQSYYDWVAQSAKLCKDHPSAVVLSFGSNDPMDMRIGGAFIRFGSVAWREAYETRSLQIIQNLQQCGVKTVWLQLPMMRDEEMQKKTKILREAQAKACAMADACVKPFETLGSELETQFLERATIAGKNKLIRAADGVHMGPEGYYLVAKQALIKLGLTASQ